MIIQSMIDHDCSLRVQVSTLKLQTESGWVKQRPASKKQQTSKCILHHMLDLFWSWNSRLIWTLAFECSNIFFLNFRILRHWCETLSPPLNSWCQRAWWTFVKKVPFAKAHILDCMTRLLKISCFPSVSGILPGTRRIKWILVSNWVSSG